MIRALALSAIFLSGCSELMLAASPLHRDQALAVEDRDDSALSLALGSVKSEHGIIEVEEVALVRRSPGPRALIVISNAESFRILRNRHLREGLFVLPNLPPGTYAFAYARRGLKVWHANEGDDWLRFEVTDPAIYDAGAIVLRDDGTIEVDRRPDQLSRFGTVLEAAKGTAWEDPIKRLRDRITRPNGND